MQSISDLQNEIVKKEALIEKLEVLNQILTVQRARDNGLQKARKTLINVSRYFLT